MIGLGRHNRRDKQAFSWPKGIDLLNFLVQRACNAATGRQARCVVSAPSSWCKPALQFLGGRVRSGHWHFDFVVVLVKLPSADSGSEGQDSFEPRPALQSGCPSPGSQDQAAYCFGRSRPQTNLTRKAPHLTNDHISMGPQANLNPSPSTRRPTRRSMPH